MNTHIINKTPDQLGLTIEQKYILLTLMLVLEVSPTNCFSAKKVADSTGIDYETVSNTVDELISTGIYFKACAGEL